MIGGLLSHEEMLNVGITRRQLDYWTRQGYLHCEDREVDTSGYPRRWPIAERDIAMLMQRMITAGVTVEVAATVARQVVETGMPEASIGDGITLLLERR